MSSITAVVSCAPSSADQQDGETSRAGATHHVMIEGLEFSPAHLDVQVGDRVVFTNLDIVPHTATADDRSWDTGNLAQNETATITIKAGMTQTYFCLYHPQMKATLALS